MRTLVSSAVWLLLCLALFSCIASADDDGFYRQQGRHLHLTTDIDDPKQSNVLVRSFDAAVSQWFAFWGIPREQMESFQVEGFVMQDPKRFRDNGLLPRSIGDFPFGTASGNQFWIHEQPSEYYTRHLLLHEGVHVLMFDAFEGAGPSWFMEGTAELLSVHEGHADGVVVNRVPANRAVVPDWGRFKVLSMRRDNAQVPNIKSVMRLPRKLEGDVEAYAWSWAAVMMLSQYPESRDAILKAAPRGIDSTAGFTRALYNDLLAVWPVIEARWAMMNLELDYGFDWRFETINISMEEPVHSGKQIPVDVQADRGWQSAGVRFPAGTSVNVSATGQVQLAETVRPWISLPTGISIRHHRGERIGKLIACVLPVKPTNDTTIILPTIVPIGDSASITIDNESWLMLRVNDAGDDLGNNSGAYTVTIKTR